MFILKLSLLSSEIENKGFSQVYLKMLFQIWKKWYGDFLKLLAIRPLVSYQLFLSSEEREQDRYELWLQPLWRWIHQWVCKAHRLLERPAWGVLVQSSSYPFLGRCCRQAQGSPKWYTPRLKSSQLEIDYRPIVQVCLSSSFCQLLKLGISSQLFDVEFVELSSQLFCWRWHCFFLMRACFFTFEKLYEQNKKICFYLRFLFFESFFNCFYKNVD